MNFDSAEIQYVPLLAAVAPWLLKVTKKLESYRIDPEDRRKFSALFGFCADAKWEPGTIHPDSPGIPHPINVSAMADFSKIFVSGLFRRHRPLKQVNFIKNMNAEGNWATFGGPVDSILAQKVFGWKYEEKRFKRTNKSQVFPIEFDLQGGRGAKMGRIINGKRVEESGRWAILDHTTSRILEPTVNHDGDISKDYLTVTCIPNPFGDSLKPHPKILFLTGSHIAGLSAREILLKHISALYDNVATGGNFQVVFECDKIKHKGGFSKPEPGHSKIVCGPVNLARNGPGFVAMSTNL